VKLHGGLINVQSKEDEGSQFVVTIPLGKNHISTGRIIEEQLTLTGNDTKSRRVDWWIPTFSDDQESTTIAETDHGKVGRRPCFLIILFC
jgi:hypothetical protein